MIVGEFFVRFAEGILFHKGGSVSWFPHCSSYSPSILFVSQFFLILNRISVLFKSVFCNLHLILTGGVHRLLKSLTDYVCPSLPPEPKYICTLRFQIGWTGLVYLEIQRFLFMFSPKRTDLLCHQVSIFLCNPLQLNCCVGVT